MIYIKDMDMPIDCLACRIACDKENYGVVGRPPKCPLAEASDGDLISRADAIDAICKVWCYTTYGMCPHDDGYCKGCDEIEAIDALPSAEAVQTQAEKCDECIHKGEHKDKMTCKECVSAEAEGSLKAIKRQIDEHWYLDPPSDEAVQGDECDHCVYKWGTKGGGDE